MTTPRELEVTQTALRNLLAVIFRDGGQKRDRLGSDVLAARLAESEVIMTRSRADVAEAALLVAQSTVLLFASVIKSGERWSVTCQEALETVQGNAAALTELKNKLKGTS